MHFSSFSPRIGCSKDTHSPFWLKAWCYAKVWQSKNVHYFSRIKFPLNCRSPFFFWLLIGLFTGCGNEARILTTTASLTWLHWATYSAPGSWPCHSIFFGSSETAMLTWGISGWIWQILLQILSFVSYVVQKTKAYCLNFYCIELLRVKTWKMKNKPYKYQIFISSGGGWTSI